MIGRRAGLAPMVALLIIIGFAPLQASSRRLFDGSDSEASSSETVVSSEVVSSATEDDVSEWEDAIALEARESAQGIEIPEVVAADTTYDLYDYKAGSKCMGEPLRIIDMEGTGTDAACRTECDALFGCKAFSVDEDVCLLFSGCESSEVNSLYVTGILDER